MNHHLTDAIVKHIFANLAIIPSDFVNLNTTKSLMEKQYLLPVQIKFDDQNNGGSVWGCQLSTEDQEVKILLGNCSQEEDILEYCLLVQLKNAPSYGLYLVCHNQLDSEAMIACTVNGKEWLECNTFLQASFLAGMEQIRETGLAWQKCKSHSEEFDKLLAFISFHHSVYGGDDEGQEG